ncbi:MAG: hypothetical protein ACTSQO_14615 [Candidatus Helarchaeota archaeon]
MDVHKTQLGFYMFCFLGLLAGCFVSMFLPFQLDVASFKCFLQVETIGFYAFIGIFIMIASFVLYCFQIWTKRNVFKYLGFYLGLSGSIESSIFGIFGFYYFYEAVRLYGVILLGAVCSGICSLASIVFIGLIYIKMGTIEDEMIDDEIVYID